MDELGTAAEPQPIGEWFIAFMDFGVNAWWHRLLRRGFRHCSAFAYDAVAREWVLFDVAFQGVDVRVAAPGEIEALAVAAWATGGGVLRVAVDRRRRGLRLIASCVSACAHLVGVRGCALTPYGLWRRLRRAGAIEAFTGART